MAAFSAPFGAGIAYAGIVPSDGLNAINADLPKAPNFVDGDAEYSPTIAVTVGGGGIWIKSTGWRLLSGSQVTNYGGTFVGNTSVAGLSAVGGSGAAGVQAQGGSGGNGIAATGSGAGSGGSFTGGATGKGIVCAGGAAAYVALQVGVGNAQFTGAQPAATDDPGMNQYLCATNICKAWAVIETDGSGNVTLLDGYNIASVAVFSTNVLVTFARAFASTNYAAVASNYLFQGSVPIPQPTTTTSLAVRFSDYGSGSVNPTSTAVRFAVQVMGRQ